MVWSLSWSVREVYDDFIAHRVIYGWLFHGIYKLIFCGTNFQQSTVDKKGQINTQIWCQKSLKEGKKYKNISNGLKDLQTLMDTNFSVFADMISFYIPFCNPVMTLVEIWVNRKLERLTWEDILTCEQTDESPLKYFCNIFIIHLKKQTFWKNQKHRRMKSLFFECINFTNCQNLYLSLKSDTQHEAIIFTLQTDLIPFVWYVKNGLELRCPNLAEVIKTNL